MLDAPPPDAERERIYSLAENMDAQLQRMGDDLREIIEHLNSANRSTNESDPIVQISRVLNAHIAHMDATPPKEDPPNREVLTVDVTNAIIEREA